VNWQSALVGLALVILFLLALYALRNSGNYG
jgi:hypothetical protein